MWARIPKKLNGVQIWSPGPQCRSWDINVGGLNVGDLNVGDLKVIAPPTLRKLNFWIA